MKSLRHKFVELIPDKLEDGMLYISIEYCTATHKCVCGCGNEVVTPLAPTDWQLTFDGETVSLSPSIGNWNFKCRSHYFIIKNKVRFARRWSDDEIEYGRKVEKRNTESFYKQKKK